MHRDVSVTRLRQSGGKMLPTPDKTDQLPVLLLCKMLWGDGLILQDCAGTRMGGLLVATTVM